MRCRPQPTVLLAAIALVAFVSAPAESAEISLGAGSGEQQEQATETAAEKSPEDDAPAAKPESEDPETSSEESKAEGEEPPQPQAGTTGYQTLKRKWRNLAYATEEFTDVDLKNGMFRWQMGVRLQMDGTLISESDGIKATVGDQSNSFNIRRARVFAEGLIFRYTKFKFEYDFAADAGLKDAYIDTLSRVPHVLLRLGNFKEPFSLERRMSGNNLGFLEWALPVATFAPGRNIGAAFHSPLAHGRVSYSIGAFTNSKETDDNRSSAKVTFTGRFTGLPHWKEDGRRLVHIGASISLRDPSDGQVQYGTRPEARFVDTFIDTGPFDADKVKLAAVEFAGVHGPFWGQAEWIGADIDAEDAGNPRFGGAYVEVGYFLTGESKPYDRSVGTFGRLSPDYRYRKGGNPFKRGSEAGALEVVGRVSTVNLNGGEIRAGEMRDLGLAMNWYLTPATRLMVNYIHSNVVDVGRTNILLLRYQFNPGLRSPAAAPTPVAPMEGPEPERTEE